MRLADRYRLLRRVGEGGGGGVFLVEDRLADNAVMVLKRLHTQAQASLAQWLVNEFQVLAQLDLPTVARVYDFGLAAADATDPGGPFFTRAFVDGTPLDEALRTTDGVSPDAGRVRRLVVSAGETLRALHRLGVVHGDLKPANLIVPPGGDRVIFIDFGLAHGALGAVDRVRGGTLAFMPPERVAQLMAGEALAPDPRADVYGLAVSLIHALGGSQEGTVTGETPVPVAVREHPALQALWEVGLRGASHDAARRFATVDDLLAAMGEEPSRVPWQGSRVVLRPEGREAELGTMLDVVARRLVRREPGVGAVLLAGEEGSGRSTLLRELAWRAQLRGVQVLALPGEPGEAPALRLRRGAEILGGEPVDPVQPDALVTALRRAARHGPVLVLADDLDRADPSIAAQLRSVAYGMDAGEALLVVASAEDEDRVKDLEPGVRVALGALDETAVAALCAQILGAVEPAVVAAVHARTRGLPLAVTGVLEALARESAVTPADVAAIDVAGRARDVADRRVAALPVEARMAAGVVAALAGEADEARVRAMVPTWAAMEAARAAGVVREGADGRWTLAHGALEDAVLAALPTGEVAALRTRVAGLLDATGAGVTARALAWLRAGDVHRAPVAAAVEALRSQGMPQAAARVMAAARGLDATGGDPAALVQEAELLNEGGMAVEAEALAARLDTAVGPLGARAALLRGQLRRLAGDLDGAGVLLARAAEADTADVAGEALVEAGRVAMARGAYAEVGTLCDRAVAKAPGARVRAAARAVAGVAAVYAGDVPRGTALLEEARASFASLALPREEATLLVYLAVGREKAGDLTGARALHEQSLDRARAAGDLRGMVSARINLGHIAQRTGELGAAIEHNEAALRLARRAGLPGEVLTARLNMASQLIRVGSLDRARAELDEALGMARETGHRDLAAAALLMLGCARARGGDVDAGLGMVAQAHAEFTALGQADDAADALLDGAEILVARGQSGDAERAGERVAQAREAVGDALGLREARARWVEGSVALARGDVRGAMDHLEAARALAEEQKDWEVLALTLAARGHAHARGGADLHARRDREKAVEVLEDRASMLPPDLRGAFWSVPWRTALREALAQGWTQGASVVAVRPVRGSGLTTSMGARPATLIAGDDRLALLLELSRRVGEEHTVERVLDQAVRSAVELTHAERGAVLLPGTAGALEVRVRTGLARGDGPDEAFSRSIAETVWIDGEPVVTLNAQGDQRFADYRSVHDLGIGAVAAVPIRARGRTLGVLYVENRRRRVAWSVADVALMSAFAEQAGVAVEHAGLVEALEARSRELEAAQREIEALLDTRTHELEDTRRSLARAQEDLRTRFTPEGMVAHTEPMRRMFAVLDRVRDTDVPVVVEGESGTGKELVARALHFSGVRARGPFVVVHCGAIPETLLESELFGHVRGAFTGADRDRRGLIASAHGGTLLLDEVTEMSPKMQVELLRVLQDRRVRPVGAEVDEPVDVRIVVATNRPLQDLVAEGRFREDLYYRLSVVTLRVPPLRERLDDIPALSQHFLGLFAAEQGGGRKRLSRDAMARLLRAPWPGNVRQLRHALERAAVMCEGDVIDVDALALGEPEPRAGVPVPSLPASVTATVDAASGGAPMSAVRRAQERQKIVDALDQVNWNKVKAAEVLGMPRRTLYRRLREYGLLD